MLKFILSSKFQMNKTSLFNLASNFKMFARKEINKTSLIENFHNINRVEHKAHNVQSNENLISKVAKENFSNNTQFGYEDAKNLLAKNLFDLKAGDTPQSKFLVSLNKFLNDYNLLQNQKFLDGINVIAINYSQNNSNFYHSTVFKFLILIDQILSKRSLADYQQANITHFAFSHLINYFGQNFFTIFEKNSENLLNYNFLYFMTINNGEFSECLKVIIENIPDSSRHKFFELFSTQIVIKSKNSQMEKIHNKEYFDSIEKNVTTPSSDLIKDFSFKYNERNLKIKLLNENVRERQEYEKLRLVYHNLIKFRNSSETIDSKFLNDLEVYLNTFFPQLSNGSTSTYPISEDYIQIKTAIDNFNKYLRNKLSLLTKIPISNKLIDSITFTNIHEVFNPLFSGEYDFSAQFTIVSEHLGNLYALELLYKFLDSQNEGEVYSMNDLYQLDLILVPFKFSSLEGVFDNVRFITDKSEVLKEIQLNLKTNPKYKIGKLYETQENEKKSVKKAQDAKGNFEKVKNFKQNNVRDNRQVSYNETVGAAKKEKFVFSKAQDKNQTLNVTKEEVRKETKSVNKTENIKEEEEKATPIKNEEMNSVEIKKEETSVTTETKHEESIPIEMKNDNSIPVEMINENTIPTEMVHEKINIKVPEAEIKTEDGTTVPNTTQSSNNLEAHPDLSRNKTTNFEKTTENIDSHPVLKSDVVDDTSLQKNNNKVTVNYDRESNNKNPFYKTNRRGYSATIDKSDSKAEEIVKPLGKIYKEIKSNQQKEKSEAKQSKESGKKQEGKKQTQAVNAEKEKSQKGEFVISPKKAQESIEVFTTKKPQQFVVPQKPSQEQIAKTKEEKTTPSVKKYKPTLKIFEPIKYQKIQQILVTDLEKSTEAKELTVSKNILLNNLEKLSIELQEQDDTFHNTYPKQNRDNIDIKLAQTKFDLNYWTEKIFDENLDDMEPQDLEKHIYTKISKVLRKYISNRDKLLMVIYSLTNPALKNEVVLDLEYCFYQLFTNSPPQSFDMNLGHIGYQTLLNNNLLDTTIKNRENLEKIIYHMEKNYYLPNNDNIKTILQICDKNFYPKYLKNLIDNYVINKNILLNEENFTYYIQIITNFEDFSQYYQNLINSSYTDFKIPVKAEFYEYLIYKYMTKFEMEKVKGVLKILNQRYITEYQDDEERLETIYTGNNLILYTIIQFVENAKLRHTQKGTHSHDGHETNLINEIQNNSKNFEEIINNIIAQNKSFNKDWMQDKEFTFLLMKVYNEFSINLKEYFSIIDNLISKNEVESVFDPKKLFKDLQDLFKFNGGKLKPDEHKLAIDVFERFLENYVRSGAIELSYEERFDIVRLENLYRFVRFYRNSKDGEEEKYTNMQLFVKFLDTVLDQMTYLRMHKNDKVNLEKVLMKVFNNNKNRVVEYIYKLDVKR